MKANVIAVTLIAVATLRYVLGQLVEVALAYGRVEPYRSTVDWCRHDYLCSRPAREP